MNTSLSKTDTPLADGQRETTPWDKIVGLFRETINDWWSDNAMRRGAALAYYTTFSVAPLLIVAIAIAGLVFQHEEIERRLLDQISSLIGPQGAAGIAALIDQAAQTKSGIIAALISLLTILVGASGVFMELQAGLNEIWRVPPPSRGRISELMRERFTSFVMVLTLGVVLFLSLVVNAVIAAVNAWFGNDLPLFHRVLEWIQTMASFGLVTVLFAMIFKLVPDARIAWRDVLIGALVTAVLFTIGQWLFGLYIAMGAVGSIYGSAGSLVLLLVWVYYAAQLLFLGAEFTQVYARTFGSRRVRPTNRVSGETAAVAPRPQ